MPDTAIDALPDASHGCGPLLQSTRDHGRPLRQQVFEYVRSRGQAARAEITDDLGISAGSATTITADLIASGHLCEVESVARESSRGRPRVALQVVPNAGYVIGIKLAFNRHTAVLSDFAGHVIASSALHSDDSRRSLDDLMDETERLIRNVLSESGKSEADIDAVGIGLPGIVDHKSGMVAWSSLITTRDENLTTAFSLRFDIPMFLDNDAHVLTLAELWFGEGRAMADFAVVTIESGVGMGLVLGNELYRGSHGMGLELGHTKVQLDGALCQCGQRGCLEAYIADYALTREAATALKSDFDKTVSNADILDTLFSKAKSGHKGAETIFRRAGRYLSLGLSNVVQLFDPDLIILSGERMQYDYLYASDVLDEMQTLTLKEGREACKVTINAWDDLVWARGAAALALSSVTNILLGSEARGA